jgi:hypothetical protein
LKPWKTTPAKRITQLVFEARLALLVERQGSVKQSSALPAGVRASRSVGIMARQHETKKPTAKLYTVPNWSMAEYFLFRAQYFVSVLFRGTAVPAEVSGNLLRLCKFVANPRLLRDARYAQGISEAFEKDRESSSRILFQLSQCHKGLSEQMKTLLQGSGDLILNRDGRVIAIPIHEATDGEVSEYIKQEYFPTEANTENIRKARRKLHLLMEAILDASITALRDQQHYDFQRGRLSNPPSAIVKNPHRALRDFVVVPKTGTDCGCDPARLP